MLLLCSGLKYAVHVASKDVTCRADVAGSYRAGQVTRSTEFHESRSISDVTPRIDTQILLQMADEELHNLYYKVKGKAYGGMDV
jgi:hypothetical protein